jgi:hypothetical protein
MKVVLPRVATLVVLTSLVAFAAGCGPSASICTSSPCSNGKPVQLCEDTDGNVTYSFGGMSCGCNTHNAASCDTCTSKVDAYCYPATP